MPSRKVIIFMGRFCPEIFSSWPYYKNFHFTFRFLNDIIDFLFFNIIFNHNYYNIYGVTIKIYDKVEWQGLFPSCTTLTVHCTGIHLNHSYKLVSRPASIRGRFRFEIIDGPKFLLNELSLYIPEKIQSEVRP
jgi:hypothetical protein